MKVNFEEASSILKRGGIIIYPTDTAFGIGCRIDDRKAVKKLFEIRKRPQDKAVPVLFRSINQVRDYILPFDKDVELLMRKYWPGALTIVLKCKKEKVSDLVRAGRQTLGVRIPDYNPLIKIIKKVGVPIIGTSANFSGKKTPFTFEELNSNLVKQVDGVLIRSPQQALQGDALSGKVRRQTSTVIDCTVIPWKILRQGRVKVKL